MTVKWPNRPKKMLLVASAGVAAVSYLACENNLPSKSPPPIESESPLKGEPRPSATAQPRAFPPPSGGMEVTGNLIVPPPDQIPQPTADAGAAYVAPGEVVPKPTGSQRPLPKPLPPIHPVGNLMAPRRR
jgi:hypothetical protein